MPAAIRKYWPGLADGQLAPAYAGIRPKLAGPGQPGADFVVQVQCMQRRPWHSGCEFRCSVLKNMLLCLHYTTGNAQRCRADLHDDVVQGPAQHGVPGLVNLFGIESPGLTSSLAIAEMVSQTLDHSMPPAKL